MEDILVFSGVVELGGHGVLADVMFLGRRFLLCSQKRRDSSITSRGYDESSGVER
jgi:hypothetical protein